MPDLRATLVVANLKQKGAREVAEAFLVTQHKENQCVSQPILSLQVNKIKLFTKWDGVTNYLALSVL